MTDNINSGMSPLKISSGFYGKNFYNSLRSGIREANYYAIANLNHTKANNYKDGNGNRVNWGYERFNQALIFGYVSNDRREYRLTFIHDKIDDNEQSQHQADAVETDRTITRFNLRLGREDLSDTPNFSATITLWRSARLSFMPRAELTGSVCMLLSENQDRSTDKSLRTFRL